MTNFQFRRKTLSHHFVPNSRTVRAEASLEFLLEEGEAPYYCMALPMLGPPGCGKTHLSHEYPLLFEQKHQQKLRSLYIEVSPRRARTDVSVDFLKACGDPDPAWGKTAEKMIRLVKLMENRYDIVFLDEFHRLINKDTQKVETEAADWVTFFLNTKLCPLVMVGEYRCDRIFTNSDQFEGRTFATCPISPFDWGIALDRQEYRQLIGAYELLVQMPRPSDLHETDCALRIHVFSRGCLRQTVQLIGTAAWIARRASSPNIRREHLADAVDTIRVGERARLPNPFRGEKVRPVRPLQMDHSDEE